jgi:hypothetical protein
VGVALEAADGGWLLRRGNRERREHKERQGESGNLESGI